MSSNIDAMSVAVRISIVNLANWDLVTKIPNHLTATG